MLIHRQHLPRQRTSYLDLVLMAYKMLPRYGVHREDSSRKFQKTHSSCLESNWRGFTFRYLRCFENLGRLPMAALSRKSHNIRARRIEGGK